jgi:drug/metabolite transporter (DMT)-like permease
MFLAVAGGVVYHIAAKSIPRDAAPTLVLVVAYATALSISGVAYAMLPNEPSRAPLWRLLHPGILSLGVGAAMIELGYVLTYRAASPVSLTSALVNGLVAALLVPVGLIAFGERMSIARAVGIVLCLAGVWLLRP